MADSKATAHVTLTVEITVGSTWGDNCTVGQIYKQAAEEALGIIDRLLGEQIRIVGRPVVTAVAIEEPPR